MNARKVLNAMVAFGLIITIAVIVSQKADALSGPVSEMADWQVTCATSATQILGPSGLSVNSVDCYNLSTTSVFLGGSGVDTTGYCVSSDTASCGRSVISADVRSGSLYCRVASGTVTLTCLGGR